MRKLVVENNKVNEVLKEVKYSVINNGRCYFDKLVEVGKYFKLDEVEPTEIEMEVYKVEYSNRITSGYDVIYLHVDKSFVELTTYVEGYVLVQAMKHISSRDKYINKNIKLDHFKIAKVEDLDPGYLASESRHVYSDISGISIDEYTDISACDIEHESLHDVNALLTSYKLIAEEVIYKHSSFLTSYNELGSDKAQLLLKFPYEERSIVGHKAGYFTYPELEETRDIYVVTDKNADIETVDRFIKELERCHNATVIGVVAIGTDMSVIDNAVEARKLHNAKRPRVYYMANGGNIFNVPSVVDEFKFINENGMISDLAYHIAMTPGYNTDNMKEDIFSTVTEAIDSNNVTETQLHKILYDKLKFTTKSDIIRSNIRNIINTFAGE